MARAKFTGILDAFEFVSFGPPMDHAAYLSKETGAIYWHSEFGDNFEELPPDIDEEGKYLSVPHRTIRVIYRTVPEQQLFQVVSITPHDYRRP